MSMSSRSSASSSSSVVSESPDIDWGAYVKTELFVFDFDQTITHKHIFPTDIEHLDPEEIKKSFADLDFFRKLVSMLRVKGKRVAIATFSDEDDRAVLSGTPLIRKYLDVAFGQAVGRSLIPDNCIESWSPDNKGMKSKLVGKNNHLDNLRTRIDPTIPKELVTLIDDNLRNCELAYQEGYFAYHVSGDQRNWTGFTRDMWPDFLKQEKKRAAGCCVM